VTDKTNYDDCLDKIRAVLSGDAHLSEKATSHIMGKIIPIVGDYAIKEIAEVRERVIGVLSAELKAAKDEDFGDSSQ
jgi:hypothetical protein